MSEKDKLYTGKIKQSGVFNFKDFYSYAYDWLSNENYYLTERSYSEKVGGETKDVEIRWEAFRKISDYFAFQIKADWRILGMKKIKVKKEGKEITMDSGVVEIKFTATLIKDYEHRWEGRPFNKFLRGIYDKYIIRNRIEAYEDKLFDEVNDFVSQCKAFLAIEAKQVE